MSVVRHGAPRLMGVDSAAHSICNGRPVSHAAQVYPDPSDPYVGVLVAVRIVLSQEISHVQVKILAASRSHQASCVAHTRQSYWGELIEELQYGSVLAEPQMHGGPGVEATACYSPHNHAIVFKPLVTLKAIAWL